MNKQTILSVLDRVFAQAHEEMLDTSELETLLYAEFEAEFELELDSDWG